MIFGINQYQFRQSHIFHGTRRGADISGVGSINQYDSYIF
jgi:hypothetical protein